MAAGEDAGRRAPIAQYLLPHDILKRPVATVSLPIYGLPEPTHAKAISNMRPFSPLSALLVAVTLLSGCTTISEADYKLAQAVTAESPSVRAVVMRECVAARNREPKSTQKEMAAFLKIPQSRFAQTVCGRVVRAFAKGRISHSDLSSPIGEKKMLRILQGN